MNSSELDTVHVQGDWGGYKEQIEEYLSCIRLSDQAFKDFTDELETFDRKIIVCMVGDHGPALMGKIAKELESQETLLLRTSVPFVIWTNFAFEDTVELDGKTISMNYLVPALLKTANINLSLYYQKMLELEEKVPILTAYSGYYDKYNILHAYDDQNEYMEMVNNYFYMEYNNLQKNRIQAIFDPAISGSVY